MQTDWNPSLTQKTVQSGPHKKIHLWPMNRYYLRDDDLPADSCPSPESHAPANELFAVAYTVENLITLLNGVDIQNTTIHGNLQITSLMNVFRIITITDIPNTVHLHHRHCARNIKCYMNKVTFHIVHVCYSSSTSQEASFAERGNVIRQFCSFPYSSDTWALPHIKGTNTCF